MRDKRSSLKIYPSRSYLKYLIKIGSFSRRRNVAVVGKNTKLNGWVIHLYLKLCKCKVAVTLILSIGSKANKNIVMLYQMEIEDIYVASQNLYLLI